MRKKTNTTLKRLALALLIALIAGPAWAATPTLIQHVSTPNTINAVPGITVRLPNPTLAGNAIIVVIQFDERVGATLSASGISDNKGNTYAAGPAVTGASAQAMALFYVLNATAGVTSITASFSGGSPQYVQTIASEWQNIVAAHGSGLATFDDTETDSWQATGTLGASGDLVYQVAAQTSVLPWNGALVTAGTQRAGFSLTSADLMEGVAAQYQVATGSVTNPAMTSETAASYVTVAMAFASGTQGTAATGIRIVRVQHNHLNGDAGTSVRLQFPSSGNLMIAGGPTGSPDGVSGVVTGIFNVPSNTWTQVPGSPLGNGAGGATLMWYSANASTSPTLLVTLGLSAPSVGGDFIFLDVAGAASDPFDTSNSATGMQDSDGNLTTVSIVPAETGELIVAFGDQNSGTITGVVADSNGHTPVFGQPTWTGQMEGPVGGTGAGNGFTLDAQMASITTTDTTAYTFVWTETSAVFEWETIAAAFKGQIARAALTSPAPGTTLPGAAATFSWSAGTGATQYWLSVGTTGVGSSTVYAQSQGTSLSGTVSGLPTDGSTVYVRLWSLLGGTSWQFNDYTYTAASLSKGAITSPAPGATLGGATATFSWSAGTGVTQYWLSVGTTGVGSSTVYAQSQGTSLSGTVSGLPTDGSTVYVRLWSLLGGTSWQFNDYTYVTRQL